MSLGMTGDQVARGDAAFGKAAAKKDRSGTAIGTGSVIGTAGLLGGGVPGARPNSGRLAQVKYGTKYEATRHLVSATRGGIFGYRQDAHQSYLNRQNADEKAHGGKKTTRVNHYLRGQGTGKIGPEKTIIRHMHGGRVASNAALVGGAGLVALGIRSRDRHVGKRDDRKADIAISGGATTAALGGGASLAMTHQGRKWSSRSAASLDAARKLNPKLGGYDVKRGRGRVPDVVPQTGTSAHVADHKRVFAGRSSKATEAAGRLRGAAGQQRYFARVYGKTAVRAGQAGKAGALVAAGGLGAKYLQVKPREVAKAYPQSDFYRDVRQGNLHTAGVRDSHAPRVKVVRVEREKLVKVPVHGLSRKQALAAGGAAVGIGAASYTTGRVHKVDTTMSDREAKRLAARYDTRGPLPKGLDRPTKMKAYEARYLASGGKKAEKWKRRADQAEVGRNIGLAGATLSAGALLAGRGRRTGPIIARTKGLRRVTAHQTETAGLAAAAGGGGSELYGEHARNRRASYANSPAGVAGSALTRMQNYTPKARS